MMPDADRASPRTASKTCTLTRHCRGRSESRWCWRS